MAFIHTSAPTRVLRNTRQSGNFTTFTKCEQQQQTNEQPVDSGGQKLLTRCCFYRSQLSVRAWQVALAATPAFTLPSASMQCVRLSTSHQCHRLPVSLSLPACLTPMCFSPVEAFMHYDEQKAVCTECLFRK
ncbi:Hypothetical protein, putative [Bodo saltans]|uniref:Uncharacterized protein n=1 Tax=Bodo saltans TaxID=75058 RepID=A0A0S4J4I0_BODSA|nr:Hypothetical protein, putative [Bodo saltans]|eukprot:CUG80218.1 Hypothetical protein, putative [Bodo saltans]